MSHSLCFSGNGAGRTQSARLTHGHHDVEQGDPGTDVEDQTADSTHRVVRMHRGDRLNEGIGQCAVLVIITPHQTLHDAGDPHRYDIHHGTDGSQPEVDVHQTLGVHLFHAPQLLDHVVHRAVGNHRHPA